MIHELHRRALPRKVLSVDLLLRVQCASLARVVRQVYILVGLVVGARIGRLSLPQRGLLLRVATVESCYICRRAAERRLEEDCLVFLILGQRFVEDSVATLLDLPGLLSFLSCIAFLVFHHVYVLVLDRRHVCRFVLLEQLVLA